MAKTITAYPFVCAVVASTLLSLFAPHKTSANNADELYFKVEDIAQWQLKAFAGNTEYAVATANDQQIITATSDRSASALFNRVDIDLNATPYLNWTWQVEQLPDTKADDSTKNGDDYAARLYVVFKTGIGFWNTASLNYVWANQRQEGEHWPNAFTSNVTMLAIESGTKHRGQWRSYKRNVAEDIRRYTNKDISTLKAIAIMTDSDNSQTHASSYYGDIWFSAE